MQELFLLGTYTRRASEGVYTIALDTEKETLTDLTLRIHEDGPTYLAQSKKGFVYPVTAGNGEGGVAAYTPENRLINAIGETGASPCYIAIDEPRQLVYGANYHKGQVTVYRIEANGGLTLTDSLVHTEAVGPHENQDKAHAHYADLTPDQRLAVCDLGTDIVYTYDVSAEGTLTLVATYQAEPGTGPRHLSFHPNGKIAYLFGELDSTVTTLAYHAATGRFTPLQKISTLPSDYHEFNGGAAIRVTKDGRFVYASNRGHNSLAVFAVADDFTLSVVEIVATQGDFPRDFNFNQSEEYLICAHQNSDNLTLFKRDAQTGQLTVRQTDVYAPECVCVVQAN